MKSLLISNRPPLLNNPPLAKIPVILLLRWNLIKIKTKPVLVWHPILGFKFYPHQMLYRTLHRPHLILPSSANSLFLYLMIRNLIADKIGHQINNLINLYAMVHVNLPLTSISSNNNNSNRSRNVIANTNNNNNNILHLKNQIRPLLLLILFHSQAHILLMT